MLNLSFNENNLVTGNLLMNTRQVQRISKLTPSVVSITGLLEPERARVEAFIKTVYAQSYDADIAVAYPTLMSIRNESGDILAAVGFRYAYEEPLFLERYTAHPIDDILKTSRHRIVEIGNLASAGGGASIFLFAALASYLNDKGIEFATVTGTDYLHRVFRKLGLKPMVICDASLDAVQEDGQSWGSYYDTNPKVLAGSVGKGVERLRKALGAEYHSCRPRMFPRLHYKYKEQS